MEQDLIEDNVQEKAVSEDTIVFSVEKKVEPEKQLQKGILLIEEAFGCQMSSLEEEVKRLKHEDGEKDKEMRQLGEKLGKLEAEREGAKQYSIALTQDNQHLNFTLRKLEAENSELTRIRNTILSSLGGAALAPKAPPTQKFVSLGDINNMSGEKPKVLGELASNRGGISNSGPDAKAFFMIAKDRLCPRVFSEFIGNMKRFQTKEISKAEALENAKTIFTDENEDLYDIFQQILQA